MKIERTKNTISGSIWGIINQFVMLIFPFVIRTCILKILGTQYVGIGSLFTSILSVLSLAELGVGSAIIYSMYQPIAENDEKKIHALLKLYKDVYTIIGVTVLVVGLFLLPFIKYFIKGDVPNGINIYIIYVIYLLNSVVSYWCFAYKSSILTAFQRNDILTKISLFIRSFFFILQIIIVCLAKNYYLYIIFMPITNATVNILTAIVSYKYYPQYKKGYGKISKEELKNIKKQVIGLLAQRLAHTSRNALDNIIISSYFGLSLVAIYGNYFYVINALTGILAVLFTAMQAGIGNSVAKESAEKNYKDFSNINFLYLWIAGWCTVCFTCLIQPFMKVWVGEKLIFSIRIVFLLAFYFYAMKMTDSIGAFISATGLWWKCKWSYLFEAVVNLILNIGLGYYFGISGIIVATIISVIFVNYCSTVIILHKNYFIKYSIRRFFEKNFFYLVITCIVTIISFGIIDKLYNEFIHYNSMILELAFKALLCVGVPNIFFFLLFFSTKQFKEASKWLLHKIKYIHR